MSPAEGDKTDWSVFPVETISVGTFLKRNLIHSALLYQTLRRARGSVLEVGIGSGAQSALLSRLLPRVVSVDNDLRILTAARKNLLRFGPRTKGVAANAFSLPFRDQSFGAALSQGLMEHFEDPQIGLLLREMLRVARSVVFSVPSDRYPRQDVGNERLLPPRRWLEIVASEVDPKVFDIGARYVRFDPEALKYSLLDHRWLGSFSVLVTVDVKRFTHPRKILHFRDKVDTEHISGSLLLRRGSLRWERSHDCAEAPGGIDRGFVSTRDGTGGRYTG